jgi:hypothetical protein
VTLVIVRTDGDPKGIRCLIISGAFVKKVKKQSIRNRKVADKGVPRSAWSGELRASESVDVGQKRQSRFLVLIGALRNLPPGPRPSANFRPFIPFMYCSIFASGLATFGLHRDHMLSL